MKILKNLFYLILMIGITFLACQAKVKKLSPDEEIRLLKNLVKEKTEAAHAEIEYWQKMGLVGGLIDAQVDEVREKTISPDAFNGLKTLKDPLFDLLASSERVGVKRLRERYESAKKALQKYAQDYIEEVVAEEVAVPVEVVVDRGEEGITVGLPPTPELPPLISPEEKEEIIAVKEEEMKVKPEMFEIPPTPPLPGAPGMPAAPGMAPPSEMAPAPEIGMEVAPVPEMGMGMMPEAPIAMGMEAAPVPEAPMPEVPAMEIEEEEIEEEVEAPAMGMEAPIPTISEGIPSAEPAQPVGMGMMPEAPEATGMEGGMEEMGPSEMEPSEMGMMPEEVVEEEVESAEAMADMELEEAPSGMALGMESPVLTGLESFSKYKNNINLVMNLLSDDDQDDDLPNIEDDEDEIQDEEDEEEAEDDE